MNIGQAVATLKRGKRVARAGWNGTGMWLEIDRYDTDSPGARSCVGGLSTLVDNFVWMKTAADTSVPWLCSQADLLAEDWEEVT